MFGKTKTYIALAIILSTAIFVLMLGACVDESVSDAAELADAAGGEVEGGANVSPFLHPCRDYFIDPPDDYCERYFNDAFQNGDDEELFTDLRECIERAQDAVGDSYCDYLFAMADEYNINLEECAPLLDQNPPHYACELWYEVSFDFGDVTLMRDLKACIDEVLAPESPYCMTLIGLGDSYSVFPGECDNRIGLADPHIPCESFTRVTFLMGDEDLLQGLLDCQAGVLEQDSDYCTFLFSVAEDNGVSIMDCPGLIGLETPHFACENYIRLAFMMENEDIVADLQDCIDAVLPSDEPYCQYLFELADEFGQR